MQGLVRETEFLDANAVYTYLLLATHFSETCAVAERGGALLGFVSGYRKPLDPSVLFVWQVAVRPDARGQGVARRLITHILRRRVCADVCFLEATVTPTNDASWALFQRVAHDLGAHVQRGPGFDTRTFGDEPHASEDLVRIGPFMIHDGSVT